MIKKLKRSDKVVTIKPTSPNVREGQTTTAGSNTEGDSTVYYDPDRTVVNEADQEMPPADVLAHELSHAEDFATGTDDPTPIPFFLVTVAEQKAVQVQNLYRAAVGLKPRITSGIVDIPDSPFPPGSVLPVPNATDPPRDPWRP